MTSISLLSINQHSPSHNSQQSVILPRFHKQFIGIGHELQQRKKQRKKIEEQQRSIANRVIFLQKQEMKAQKTLKRKKSQLGQVIETIQRNNQQKQQVHFNQTKKQYLRQLRAQQLQFMREENKNRRLMHKEASQTSKFIVENQKHQTYSRIKSFIKEKEQQKKDFLYDDMKSKKDKWMSLNIDKQKGKQRVDQYYKSKNTQHTLNYMQRIQKQEGTKLQKMHTIKHLEMFESALRKKLQESSMKVSQMQDKILQTSRTIDVRRSTSQQRNNDLALPIMKSSNNRNSNLSSYVITPSNPQQNAQKRISFQNNEQYSEQNENQTERLDYVHQNDDQIEENIEGPTQEEIQMSGFKIIRTLKRRKRSTKNRYKQYLMA